MNKLEKYQAYANKCADKLGVPHPNLRWSGPPCSVHPGYYAHCHIADGAFPRGTICLSKKTFARETARIRNHTIAHEVCHLAVKSSHRTPSFDRRMVALGVANYSERLNARSAKRGHHHVWRGCVNFPDGRTHQCIICGKHNGNRR